ncbi:UTRA domain protein [compost metagenome]
MRAINADHNIASILDINKGTAILKRERLVSDIGNRQIEYNIVYYCTDYFSYDIDIKREF